MTEHRNVFMALAAAQMEMEPAKKNAINPHFRNKYADLAGVVTAVAEPLNKHGLAYFHYLTRDDTGRYMVTALVHGASGTRIECPVELMIGKADMQGYKSATTYAKRIGLESVTGLPTEDDDGNAAAKNPPLAKGHRFHGTADDFEQPHDPETGELLPEDTGGANLTAWMDGIKDKLGRGATREQIAKAYAVSIIEKIGTYKKAKWLDLFLSVHDPAISRLPNDIAGDVHNAIAKQRAQINGEKFDPADFAPAGMYDDKYGPEDYLRG